jgi:hypothetical protein
MSFMFPLFIGMHTHTHTYTTSVSGHHPYIRIYISEIRTSLTEKESGWLLAGWLVGLLVMVDAT